MKEERERLLLIEAEGLSEPQGVGRPPNVDSGKTVSYEVSSWMQRMKEKTWSA